MTFPSAAVRESSVSETPRRLGGNSVAGVPTCSLPDHPTEPGRGVTSAAARSCYRVFTAAELRLGGAGRADTTWISPATGRDFPGIFNQPVEVPHPNRRKEDK